LTLRTGNRKLLFAAIPVIIFAIVTAVYFWISSNRKDFVARIGNEYITQEDFRKAYEFAYPQLKPGKTVRERKEAFLNFMINEKLIALKGYAEGVDRKPEFISAMKPVEDELLLETLIDTDIRGGITVGDDEIREAINKSKVKFSLRFWVSEDKQKADEAFAHFQKTGLSKGIKDYLSALEVRGISPDQFRAENISWLELTPEVFESIRNLREDEISRPVKIDDSYFIFQVYGIKREGITENEYSDKYSTYKKMLFNKKVNEKTVRYVSDLMTPKNIVTKGPVFRVFADAASGWVASCSEEEFAAYILNPANKNRIADALRGILNETMVEYSGGKFTVRDILRIYSTDGLKEADITVADFRRAVNGNIARSLRDHFLAEKARSSGYESDPGYLSSVTKWRDKFLFSVIRDSIFRSVAAESDQLKDYFNKNIAKYKAFGDTSASFQNNYERLKSDYTMHLTRGILLSEADKLRKEFGVEINHEVLDKLVVSETEKSKNIHFELLRGGTNRMVEPKPDLFWSWK